MRRMIFVLLLATLIPTAGWAQLKLPSGIPQDISDQLSIDKLKVRIPGLEKILQSGPSLTMTPADSVPSVSFLDDFDPRSPLPLSELPFNHERGFPMIFPGVFEHHAQSYCLNAGTYGPGGGDGYLHVKLNGPMAEIITTILQNSCLYPDMSQSDVQGLIWAVMSRSKIDSLSAEYRAAARKLLTPKQIRDLNGGALTIVPPELREQAFAHLPPLVRQTLEIEATLRSLFIESVPFAELERIAVLSGDPPRVEGMEEYPLGRWLFDPSGYFLRYLPLGYSETRMQVYVPELIDIETDSLGRITSVSDTSGNRIELDYSDSSDAVQADNAPRAYALSSIKCWRTVAKDEPVHTEWKNIGWTIVGAASEHGSLAEVAAGFPDTDRRLKQLQAQKMDLEQLFQDISRFSGRQLSADFVAGEIAHIADIGSIRLALDEVLSDTWDTPEWAMEHKDLLHRAWMSMLASAVLPSADDRDAYEPDESRYMASLVPVGIGTQMARSDAMRRRERLDRFNNSINRPWENPGGYAAVPAAGQRQMLGQSGRASPNSNGKEILDKTEKGLKWLGYGKLVLDFVTGPKDLIRDAIGYGVRDHMFSITQDWQLSMAREISKALGGDPPRDDFKETAAVEIQGLVLHPEGDIPPARLAALNAVMESLADLNATMRAGVISYDRFGGAVEAGDDEWAIRQAINMVKHKRNSGLKMLVLADKLDDLLEELRQEGVEDIIVEADSIRQYQNRLRTQGFTQEELSAARAVGLTEDEIEAERQLRIEGDPEEVAGSIIQATKEAAWALRELGAHWSLLPDTSTMNTGR